MKRHDHEIDIPDEIEFDESVVKKFIERFETKSSTEMLHKIGKGSKNLIHLFSTNYSTEEDCEEIYRNLYLFLQTTANFYLMAQTDKDSIKISVDDIYVSVPISGYEDYIGIHSWLDGYMYALAGRENNVIELLSSCSESEIRKGDSAADQFFYSYIEFLKHLESHEAEKILNKVFKDCEEVKIASREIIDSLIVPQLELWRNILHGDAPAFNQNLEKAVQKHYDFWKQRKSDLIKGSYRCNSINGLIAMRLTGIAAYAYDKKINVTYHSDYLPRFMIEGEQKLNAKVIFPRNVES